MKTQAQPSPIVHYTNDNARNSWVNLTEEANFLNQNKSDLRPDMQRFFGHICGKCWTSLHGVLANYMDRIDERLQSIEVMIKAQSKSSSSTKEANYIHQPQLEPK